EPGQGIPSQYQHLSFTDHAIRKRGNDGSGWRVVFSEYGSFSGAFFFMSWAEDQAFTVAPRAMETAFLNDPNTVGVAEILLTSDCDYYPESGQTLCDGGETSGGSESADGRGFFAEGIGFRGHRQYNCIAEGCLTEEWAVVRSALTGPAPACGPTEADPRG